MRTSSTDASNRPHAQPLGPAARGALGLTALMTLGTALMAISHAGVTVPVFSAIGPATGVVVPVAAAGFAVATLVLAAALVGLTRRRAWGWALATLAHALVAVSAAVPIRGAGSLLGLAVSAVALVLLLTPSTRRDLVAS